MYVAVFKSDANYIDSPLLSTFILRECSTYEEAMEFAKEKADRISFKNDTEWNETKVVGVIHSECDLSGISDMWYLP